MSHTPPTELARVLAAVSDNFVQMCPEMGSHQALAWVLGYPGAGGMTTRVDISAEEERYVTRHRWRDDMHHKGAQAFLYSSGQDVEDCFAWMIDFSGPEYELGEEELRVFIEHSRKYEDCLRRRCEGCYDLIRGCLKHFEIGAFRPVLLSSPTTLILRVAARVYIDKCEEADEPLERGQPEDDRILALAQNA